MEAHPARSPEPCVTATCPTCSTSVPARAEFCPQCLGELGPRAAASASPAVLAPLVATVPEALNAPADSVAAAAPLVSEEGPLCSVHPFKAANKCRQCNAFYCGLCLPADARPGLCPGCNTVLALREAPEQLRKLFRALWLSPAVLGLTLLVLGFAEAVSGGAGGAIVMFFSFALCTIFLVMSFVIGVSKAVEAGWTTFVLELLLLLLMMTGGSVFFAVVLAVFPLMTVRQLINIHHLQALMKAHPAGRPQG